MEKYFDINGNGHSIRSKIYYNNMRTIQTVIVCGHGFAGHKDNKSTERFAETVLSKYKDVAVLIFDWPAHGKDVKKRLTLGDCDAYLTLVLDYVKNTLGATKILGYANSFGGYVFLKYIHEHGDVFEKLVLRSPAIDIYESVTNKIMTIADKELIAQGKDAQVGFDKKISINGQYLEELKASDVRKNDYSEFYENILIIQGMADEVIDVGVVEKFADDNLIELIPIENADHRYKDFATMGNVIKYAMDFLLKKSN